MRIETARRESAALVVRELSAKATTDLVPHLFAEGFPARGSLSLGEIVPVEDVEVVEDRMAIAGHRQDAELFGDLFAGTADFPSANHGGAGFRRKTAQPGHIGCRQRPADGVSEIRAELFQFMAGHGENQFVQRCICMI